MKTQSRLINHRYLCISNGLDEFWVNSIPCPRDFRAVQLGDSKTECCFTCFKLMNQTALLFYSLNSVLRMPGYCWDSEGRPHGRIHRNIWNSFAGQGASIMESIEYTRFVPRGQLSKFSVRETVFCKRVVINIFVVFFWHHI